MATGLIHSWTKTGKCGCKRRGQIEASLASLELTTAEIETEAVDQDLVMKALADFSKVFAEIQPYKQKELLRLILHKAILSPDYVKMALYGRPPEIGPLATAEPRSQICNWLLGQVSQGVVLMEGAPHRSDSSEISPSSRARLYIRISSTIPCNCLHSRSPRAHRLLPIAADKPLRI